MLRSAPEFGRRCYLTDALRRDVASASLVAGFESEISSGGGVGSKIVRHQPIWDHRVFLEHLTKMPKGLSFDIRDQLFKPVGP